MDTEVGTDQASGFDDALRERLAAGVDVARAAVEEFAADGVGEHLGTAVEAPFTTTHRFASDLAGYRGWHWACVLALVPGGDLTIDEISLLPGAEAVVAPEWVPWEKRIRAGDLGVGDLLPPAEDDERLVPGQLLTGDEELDELTAPVGLGRPRHLSREGRSAAAARWITVHGPESEIARGAKHHCGTCGFLTPITGSLGAMFGVCANEFSADGQVVHLEYGCGAHSEVRVKNESSTTMPEAYDDSAVDMVVLPQQLAASAARREDEQGAAGDEAADQQGGADASQGGVDASQGGVDASQGGVDASQGGANVSKDDSAPGADPSTDPAPGADA